MVVVAALLACTAAAPLHPSDAPAGAPPQVATGVPELPRGGTARPAPAGPAAPVRVIAGATIAATGDVLMHGAVKDAAADHRSPTNDEGFGWLYAPIADLLASSDLTFANLESPIAPRSGQGSRPFVFNAPPAAVRALRSAGVDVVSVANNHVYDQGRAGFVETLAEVDRAGLVPIGAGEAPAEAGPRVVEVNGLRVALLGWAHFFNQDGHDCPPSEPRCTRAAKLDRDRAVELVREAAQRHDAVVVSVHWGDEYASQPRAEDVALARRLCDAGALAVVGHHPHVLQPIELHQRPDGSSAVIAYSLGNFISNQSRQYVHGVTPEQVAATRDGAILRFRIAKRDYGRGVVQTELAGVEYWPLWTENDTAERDRKTGARPKIRVVSIDRALAEVRAELAALADPLPPAERTRFTKLRRREELYLARKRAIAATLGEDLEAAPPPRP
jgi:poly-gamma-glutamate capsule biosynthesis protein CapA/YwtB (metallophosphatase superfamily)